MFRSAGTDRVGNQFSLQTRLAVWQKAAVVPGVDPRFRRMDSCGALIDWDKYGDTTEFGLGWEIDHVYPVALGGSDALSNLQPLQWQNNRAKSDHLSGGWACSIVARR